MDSKTKKKLFESLHLQYHSMVVQMCLGYMKGEHGHAQDLAQDVFINIWIALDKFKGASSYKTWIYRITVNTCLKFIRDRKDKTHIPIENLEYELHESLDGGDLEQEDDHRRLYRKRL